MASREAEIHDFYYNRLTKYLKSGGETSAEGIWSNNYRSLVPGTGGKREVMEDPIKKPGPESISSLLLFTAGRTILVKTLHKAFSDFDISFQKLIPEEGGEHYVAGRGEWTGIPICKRRRLIVGTHTGEFLGIAPTGKKVCVRCMFFDRLVDGTVDSQELLLDFFSLLVQLGAIQPPKVDG
jgi:predicted ester cyclase